MNPPDPIDTAIAWLTSALLGQAATAVAVIAVAGIGFAMLQGRQPAREAIRVFLGCVILFNAPTIASALSERSDESAAPSEPPLPPPVPLPPMFVRSQTQGPNAAYDPYAGASVPQ